MRKASLALGAIAAVSLTWATVWAVKTRLGRPRMEATRRSHPAVASAEPPSLLLFRAEPRVVPGRFPDPAAGPTAPVGPAAAGAFAAFPTDRPVRVDFLADEATFGRLTDRERRDQALDWLLFTVVTAAALPPQAVDRCLFDVPAVRHAYLKPVASFDYGDTRFCSVGDGRVVALLPPADRDEQIDRLAHIVDTHCKNTGEKPRILFPFAYRIEPRGLGATLTRQKPIDVDLFYSDLFGGGTGYYEKAVETLDDLGRFLARTDAFTCARFDAGRLVLAGRKIKGRAYRGIGVEDVAALWKSAAESNRAARKKVLEDEIKKKIEAFDDRWSKKVADFNRRVEEQNRRGGADGPSRSAVEALGREKRSLEEEQRREQSRLVKELREEVGRRGSVIQSGFSLDPRYDREALAAIATRAIADLQSFSEGKGPIAVTEDMLRTLGAALRKGTPGPYYDLLDRLGTESGPVARGVRDLLEMVLREHRHSGEYDHQGLARLLGRAENAAAAVAAGRLPGLSEAEFRGIREALARGDEAPFRAALNRVRSEDGPVAQYLDRLFSDADQGFRTPTVADRAGLARWLGQLEEELKSTGSGDGALTSDLRKVREALRRGDGDPYRRLAERWSRSGRFITTRLGAQLLDLGRSYEFRGAYETVGLSRAVAAIESGFGSLASGPRPTLSPQDVRRVREALAAGRDDTYFALVDRLQKDDGEVPPWIAGRIAAECARFLAVDHMRLAARVAEIEAQVRDTFNGPNAVLRPDLVRAAREQIARGETSRYNFLMLLLRMEDARAGEVGLYDTFRRACQPYRAADFQGMADALGKLGPHVRTLHRQVDGLREAARALSDDADSPTTRLLVWIARISHDEENPISAILGDAFHREIRAHRYQAARYDGDLQGTEVGMTLFYTDLFAKLRALDYMPDQPGQSIVDFRSLPAMPISPVFQREIAELPGTRLWFGPDPGSYQVAQGGEMLLLAHNATRIYSASANDLRPGQESAPNAEIEAFLGWWSDHFEEVARYEPYYERLNEVMKWSLLIAWLDSYGKGSILKFLEPVGVDHSKWFPDWAAARPELRFRRWDRVPFFGRGFKGNTTEAMAILDSSPYKRFGSQVFLSGGVSLAAKESFGPQSVLPGTNAKVDPLCLRSYLDYRATAATGGGSLVAQSGARFNFEAPVGDRSAFVAIPARDARLRSRYAEIRARQIRRAVGRDEADSVVTTWIDGVELGQLRIGPTGNGFRVESRPRDHELATSLAIDLSTSPDHIGLLAADPRVEAFVAIRNDRYLVRLNEARRWLLVAREADERLDGWQWRVAAATDSARVIDLAWTDTAIIPATAAHRWLRLDLPDGPDEGVALRIVEEGSSTSAKPVRLRAPSLTLAGRRGPDAGSVLVPLDGLPKAVRGDADLLTAFFSREALAGLSEHLRRTDSDEVTYDLAGAVGAPAGRGDSLIADIEVGAYARAAREIVDDSDRAWRRVDRHLSRGLGLVDRYLRAGRHPAAIFLVEDLARVHGDAPDLAFRLAVAEAVRGSTAGAAQAANGRATGVPRDRGAFLDCVNGLLPHLGYDAGVRSDLLTLAAICDIRDLGRRGALRGASVTAYVEGERLQMEYRLARQPEGSRVGVSAIEQPGPVAIYVEDHPDVNRLDWSPARWKTSVQRAVLDGLATLVGCDMDDLDHFRPARVSIGENGPRFRRRSPIEVPSRSATEQPAASSYSPYSPPGTTLFRPSGRHVLFLRVRSE